MEKLKDYAGLSLIIVGTLTLAATRVLSITSSNTVLLTGLLCIVAGTILHIHNIKRESRY